MIASASSFEILQLHFLKCPSFQCFFEYPKYTRMQQFSIMLGCSKPEVVFFFFQGKLRPLCIFLISFFFVSIKENQQQGKN